MHAYERIVTILAGEIEAGEWAQGEMLPTMKDLGQRFDVSQITIRTALEQLTQRGLVYTGYSSTEGRRGAIIRARGRESVVITDDWSNRQTDRDGFAHFAEELGKKPGATFEMRFALPPQDVARHLRLESDELAVIRISRQTLDGEPWSLEVSWYPRGLAEECKLDVPQDIPGGTLRRLADCGYTETGWVDKVTDERADAETAQALSVEVGAAVLVHQRTAASGTTLTRVTRYIKLGGRACLLWRLGSPESLAVLGDH